MSSTPRLGLLAAIACLLLAACAEPEPIRIGFSGQLSGPKSDLGVQGRNGALLAVEEINARGGVAGHRLELVAEDDQDTPEGARQADARLLAQKVVAIVGHMTSGQTLAALPDLEASGTILISPTTASPLLSEKQDLFFRVITSNAQWARGLADHCLRQDRRRVFLLGDSDNVGYTETFLDAFERRLRENAGMVSGRRLYSSSKGLDTKKVAAEILAAKPQALIACVAARDLAALAQALHPQQAGIAVMGPPWPSTRDLVLTGGKDVEGFEFISNYAEDNSHPAFAPFLERYRKRFGWAPNFAAAFAYETVTVLAEGLRRTEGKRAGLEHALVRGQTMEGIIGPFVLDDSGDVRRPNFITRVQEGRFVTRAMTGL